MKKDKSGDVFIILMIAVTVALISFVHNAYGQ